MSLEANTRKNRSLISCWPNVNSVVTLVIAGEFTSLVGNAGNMMTTRGKRFRGKNDCVLCTKKTKVVIETSLLRQWKANAFTRLPVVPVTQSGRK